MAVLMASTMLAGTPVLAAEAAGASPGSNTFGEIIVTASKREENIQKVPMSIQAIDTKKLTQLNVTSFQDYVKFMPSVQFQNQGPGASTLYMRGVSDGGVNNHSGPQPSVGSYLDEQPITTIGGTLDVHIYDVARVEVLPGPQGTLYGASSEAGTLRIITNKPSTSGFSAGYDLQANTVAHGGQGYVAEGFVNVPITSNVAIRLVGFSERDAGFIDNVAGTRSFIAPESTINNSAYVKHQYNSVETYGGRVALKWDITDNWSVTPSVIAQDARADGVFGFEPSVGDLQVQRFAPDSDHDRWAQAALTINGKIGRFNLTYSGGYFNRKVNTLSDYTDYSVAYDQASGGSFSAYTTDRLGNPLANPQQVIVGTDRFEKGSNELRIASPSTDRFRIIVGLFQERQTHWIVQNYQIQGLNPALSVTGWPNTWWLTDQNRIDRDEAVFGEAAFDITPKLSITGGIRGYRYNNTLFGYYGYATAEQGCFPGLSFRNAPCVDLNASAAGSGETHKVNLTYKLDDSKLVYFTYSTGYRPGGNNRVVGLPPYKADSLTNFELGWKTSWLDRSLHWNGAAYLEDFNQFQFSVLFPPNSLTGVENAPSAQIMGVESSVDWRANGHLTLSAGAAYNHAVLTADFCGVDEAGAPLTSCAPGTVEAPKGQQLPFTPKFKGSVTARYTFDMMGWNAHAQASVIFQTMTFAALKTSDIDALGNMPGYATVDLSAGAERNNLSIEVFIKNAFNERGQINRSSPCTTCEVPNGPYPAFIYVTPTTPLLVGLRFGQKF